eukprot:3031877-Rhodomonas_salina.1
MRALSLLHTHSPSCTLYELKAPPFASTSECELLSDTISATLSCDGADRARARDDVAEPDPADVEVTQARDGSLRRRVEGSVHGSMEGVG